MVLDHVAKGARPVIIVCPALKAKVFCYRDLDMVNIVLRPERFKQNVGEPQHHKVLDCLLAEIVIDTEHLPLGKYFGDPVIDRLR